MGGGGGGGGRGGEETKIRANLTTKKKNRHTYWTHESTHTQAYRHNIDIATHESYDSIPPSIMPPPPPPPPSIMQRTHGEHNTHMLQPQSTHDTDASTKRQQITTIKHSPPPPPPIKLAFKKKKEQKCTWQYDAAKIGHPDQNMDSACDEE